MSASIIDGSSLIALRNISDQLFPGRPRGMLFAQFRRWLNEKTGLDVKNGPIAEVVQGFAPRILELVHEKGIAVSQSDFAKLMGPWTKSSA